MKKEISVVLESPRKMAVKEFEIPELSSKDLLLKIEMTSICGTDPKLYEDKFFTHTFPIILGHEIVGFVEEVGEDAAGIYGVQKGDRVTIEPQILCGKCRYCLTGYYQLCKNARCYGVDISSDLPPHLWGGYGEYLFVSEGSKVHKISASVPPEAACLSSVLGNGIRWVRTKGEVKFGESVVIIGPGAQGLVSTVAANESGACPIIVLGRSLDDKRFKLAKEFGADYTIDLEKEDPVNAVKEITSGEMVDVVIECSGASSALELGLDLLKPLGRYILVGMTGNTENSLITDRIVAKELTVIGGNGQSWDVELAVQLINSKKYPLEKIITHVFAIEEAEKAMELFINEKRDCIRAALRNAQ
ncbi:zinc-binding dehydrogenase [bacterium]|nr:zinc-binding dehydrogenase [bacterium]